MSKVIIAGSRTIYDTTLVRKAIKESGFILEEIVSGGARGVDQAAIDVGMIDGISLKIFPAKWNEFGNGAGRIRNGEMADYADALIAIWDGQSNGTRDMIERAEDKGMPVYVRRQG